MPPRKKARLSADIDDVSRWLARLSGAPKKSTAVASQMRIAYESLSGEIRDKINNLFMFARQRNGSPATTMKAVMKWAEQNTEHMATMPPLTRVLATGHPEKASKFQSMSKGKSLDGSDERGFPPEQGVPPEPLTEEDESGRIRAGRPNFDPDQWEIDNTWEAGVVGNDQNSSLAARQKEKQRKERMATNKRRDGESESDWMARVDRQENDLKRKRMARRDRNTNPEFHVPDDNGSWLQGLKGTVKAGFELVAPKALTKLPDNRKGEKHVRLQDENTKKDTRSHFMGPGTHMAARVMAGGEGDRPVNIVDAISKKHDLAYGNARFSKNKDDFERSIRDADTDMTRATDYFYARGYITKDDRSRADGILLKTSMPQWVQRQFADFKPYKGTDAPLLSVYKKGMSELVGDFKALGVDYAEYLRKVPDMRSSVENAQVLNDNYEQWEPSMSGGQSNKIPQTENTDFTDADLYRTKYGKEQTKRLVDDGTIDVSGLPPALGGEKPTPIMAMNSSRKITTPQNMQGVSAQQGGSDGLYPIDKPEQFEPKPTPAPVEFGDGTLNASEKKVIGAQVAQRREDKKPKPIPKRPTGLDYWQQEEWDNNHLSIDETEQDIEHSRLLDEITDLYGDNQDDDELIADLEEEDDSLTAALAAEEERSHITEREDDYTIARQEAEIAKYASLERFNEAYRSAKYVEQQAAERNLTGLKTAEQMFHDEVQRETDEINWDYSNRAGAIDMDFSQVLATGDKIRIAQAKYLIDHADLVHSANPLGEWENTWYGRALMFLGSAGMSELDPTGITKATLVGIVNMPFDLQANGGFAAITTVMEKFSEHMGYSIPRMLRKVANISGTDTSAISDSTLQMMFDQLKNLNAGQLPSGDSVAVGLGDILSRAMQTVAEDPDAYRDPNDLLTVGLQAVEDAYQEAPRHAFNFTNISSRLFDQLKDILPNDEIAQIVETFKEQYKDGRATLDDIFDSDHGKFVQQMVDGEHLRWLSENGIDIDDTVGINTMLLGVMQGKFTMEEGEKLLAAAQEKSGYFSIHADADSFEHLYGQETDTNLKSGVAAEHAPALEIGSAGSMWTPPPSQIAPVAPVAPPPTNGAQAEERFTTHTTAQPTVDFFG